MKTFQDFTGLYQLSKTLRFELKPQTKENQSINDFWQEYLQGTTHQNDLNRSDAYPIVKTMLDQYHKWFIERVLENMEMDWSQLYNLYVEDKRSDSFRKMQDNYRTQIVEKYFKKHEWWEYISKNHGKLVNLELVKLLKDDCFLDEIRATHPEYTPEVLENALKKFNKFSVYFDTYFQNRDNMYSDKNQGTAIANRIVNENFIKHAINISIYQKLKDNCANELKQIEDNLNDYLQGISWRTCNFPWIA